ncbi:hypothetical protein D6Z43_16370 [Pseudomonas sp. DY-1]|uniref:hypothetical protein n=1 Tax=Pseudomonas sp. DY-1 TaxID=1755504 RepID=UPI000EA9823D|nr:hypothetical protein [Pseudomonas sp. DY-1]AYF88644.1 hypothetical protein D6Z43_16370 [Pseudomonas sp. DY-1]
MDSKLIDETLLQVLQLPEAKRTPERILSHLTLAATAADAKLHGASPLQLEHMKLAAAVGHLAGELGEGFTYRTNLRLGPDLEGLELCATIEARTVGAEGPRWVAFGGSAERVLATLRRDMEQHGKTIEQRSPRRRRNDNPLRHLPRERRA